MPPAMPPARERKQQREQPQQPQPQLPPPPQQQQQQQCADPKINQHNHYQQFRPPGAPAGSWHPMHWSHCIFADPYERVNFWSHAVPGLLLAVLGVLAARGSVPGGPALWVFCICAATTHLLSALTHVYPDDHALEKLDHVGIVVLIVGTPLSQSMMLHPGDSGDLSKLAAASLALLGAAFLRPLLRTTGFVLIGAWMVATHGHLLDAPLLTQCALYVAGAAFFLRNGGHDRVWGLQDHHFLHYFVTLACGIHVANVMHRTAGGSAH